MSADSIDRKKNKVVAQVTQPPGVYEYDWVNGAAAQPQNRPRTADRAARVGSLVTTAAAGQPAYNYEAGTPVENSAYNQANAYNQPGPQAGTVDPYAAYGGIAGLTKMLQNSGSGSGSNTDSPLDWAKWNAQQASDATASAATLRALQGMQGRLASGGYRGNADTLLDLISGRSTDGQKAITGLYDTDVSNVNDAYDTETGYANDIYNTGVTNATKTYNTGVGNINAGFDTAQGMVNTGYDDLNRYLNANQIDPYANLQQQVSPVNNAMADYLSAYGVSNDPVNQQVQASSIANQEGANSFNQLQQLMSANQLANNQSNLGVSQAAQNYATTGLGTQRAGYLANAEAARMSAMNQLMDQIDQARYGVEQDAGNRKNALEEAIIGAGGSTSATAADVNPDTGRVDTGPAAAGPSSTGQPAAVPGSATTRAQKVAAAPDIYPNFKAALKVMSPNYKFTTMAAAKKAFKPLAAAFKK